jgi:hypothetical protein
LLKHVTKRQRERLFVCFFFNVFFFFFFTENKQERQVQSTPTCLICLEPYVVPVVSVNCWHVHCEKCWLRTLGAKKLCPRCQTITSPLDLRKIYM